MLDCIHSLLNRHPKSGSPYGVAGYLLAVDMGFAYQSSKLVPVEGYIL